MGQASITVDILAKVKGWQEELARLKSAAAKVDIGSDFGKSLQKAISDLDSRVSSMARNVTKQLTSESGIDSFTDKVNNIDLAFKGLGEHLSNVTFDNLDPTYVTNELKALNDELTKTSAALDEAKQLDFSASVSSFHDLNTALTRLGEDPALVNFKEIPEILKRGIEESAAAIETADTQLVTLRENLRSVKEESKQLSSAPVLAIQDMHAAIQSIVGNKTDYGINIVDTKALDEKVQHLRERLQIAGVDITDDSNKINIALSQLANSKTVEELEINFQKLKAAVSESNIKLGDVGLSGRIDAMAKALMHDDVAKLEQARAALEQKLRDMEIPQEVIDKLVPEFTKGVQQGKWDQAVRDLEAGVATYKAALQQSAEELKAEENKLTDSINGTKSTRGKAELTKNVAERALNTDYPAMIKQLQAKNEQLEKKVAELEALIKQNLGEILNKTRGTGSGISKDSDKQLEENAAAARMYKDELAQVQAREQMIGKIQGVVQRWFSIYAAVRMVTNAIKSVISTVKELDATITEIAIVTKMSQGDLWGQMESYTNMARKYAASISGVYKVSQLYYQQGLGQNDVMALTEQTLKMARISGLDYADATDYMTNAVRSFKMEMTDAQTVVDVYSAVAASSATNVTELATAMSKTASSAQAVGSSFQNTTAMMAVMIEATRESAENIGSAMKSIISRYGELKENKTGIDSEGEEYSLNKVDTALQSVGLSIHDAKGEFRDFDDVIMELSEKWDTIDKNTQRYIATVMAGNRQQSRFLALVSSYDRLKELSEEAADSENASQLQFLKTLDSIDAKTQQLKTSLQSLYTDSGIETGYKGILTWLNNIATTLNNMSTIAGLPIPAIIKIGTTFASLANVVTTIFGLIKTKVSAQLKALTGETAAAGQDTVNASNSNYQQDVNNYRAAAQRKVEIERQTQEQIRTLRNGGTVDPTLIGGGSEEDNVSSGPGPRTRTKGITRGWAITGLIANMAGLIMSGIADNIGERTKDDRSKKAWLTGSSNLLQGVGLGASFGGGWGALIGGVLGAAKGAIEAVGIATETTAERINNLNTSIEETSNQRIIDEAALKTLEDYKKKYDELEKTKDLSPEDHEAWISLNAEIAETYPQLLSYIDEEGNKIVSLGNAYDQLVDKKRDAYEKSFLKDIQSHIEAYSDLNWVMKDYVDAAANTVTSSRPTKVLGSYLTFDVNSDQMQASTAQQFMEEDNDLISRAGGDKQLLNQLYKQKYGYTWDEYITWLQSDNTTEIPYSYKNRLGMQMDGSISGELFDSVVAYYTTLDEEFDYFTGQLDSYIESALTQLTSYYGADKEFAKYGVLNDQVADQLNKEWQAQLADARKHGISESTAFKTFFQQIPNLVEKYNQDLINNHVFMDETVLSEANDVWVNTKNYSVNYLASLKEAGNAVGALLSPDQFDDISEYAAQQGKKIEQYLTSIIEKAKNNDLINKSDYEWFEGLPEDFFDFEFMNDIPLKYQETYAKQVANIIQSSSFANSDKQGAIEKLLGLRDEIFNSFELTDKEKNQVDEIIGQGDFTTITGIMDTQQKLAKMGVDVDFSDLLNTVIPNFELEYKTLEQKIAGNIKDLDKALSKAQKGMSLDEAVELAEQLGVSLSDDIFDFRGGKFFVTDVNAIRDYYYNGLLEIEDALQQRQMAMIDETKAIFTKGKAPRFDRSNNQLYQSIDTLVTEGNFEGQTRNDKVNRLIYQGGLDSGEADKIVTLYERYGKDWRESGTASFMQYALDRLEESKDSIDQQYKDYVEYQTNAFLIQNGQLTEFFENLVGEGQDAANYAENVINGEWDQLPEEARQYIDLLYNFVKDAQKNVFDAAIKSIKGEGPTLITVTAANKQLLEDILDPDEVLQEGQQVLVDITKDNLDSVKAALIDSSLTNTQKAQVWEDIHNIEFPDITEGFESIITNGEIGYNEAAAFIKTLGKEGMDVGVVMEEYGFTFNRLTGKWKANETALNNVQQEINLLREKEDLTDEEADRLDELQSLLDEANNAEAKERSDAFKDVLKNYKSVTSEMILNLSKFLSQSYEEVQEQFFTLQDDGTYQLDLDQIQTLLKEGGYEVGSATYNALMKIIADAQDDILQQITGAGSYSTKGTTSIADMQQFANEFNEGLAEEDQRTVDQLFEYDSELRAFKLNPQAMYQYVQRKREELQKLGMTDSEINQYISDYTENLAGANVDITAFLKSGDKSEGSTAWTNFRNQLKTWATNRYFGFNPAESTLNSWMNTIRNGGAEAVKLARTIKGTDLSDDEIVSIYNSAVDEIKTAIDQVEAKEGEIIDAHAAKVLKRIYGEDAIEDLGNGKAIIKALPEGGRTEAVVQAYTALYKEMQSHDEATLADLNNAFAKILTANEYDQSRPIEAIENAASMTYEQLGEILAQEGFTLEDVYSRMSEFGIERLGAGKVRIKDFTTFAGKFAWDTNTEEYTAAFKEYNDDLIEYNKHVADEIKGEFDTLIKAKVGDEVNLTRMVSEFGEDKITELLEGYGATINNGILTITETDAAKRVELYRKIGQLAVTRGAMLETEFQATMDQISKQNKMDLIDSYKTMIQGYSSISMETIRKYAETVNQNYSDVISNLGLTDNGDGTYAITLTNLKALLDQGKAALGEEVYNQLMAEVASVMDNLISGISSSASFTTAGTTSQKEMVDFTNEFRKVTKNNSIETTDLFEYNDALSTFILKSDKFYEYLRAQSQELKNLGMSEEEISTYLTNEALNLVESNIDIQGYLQSAQRGKGSKARETLRSQIEQALTTKWYGVSPDEATLEYYVNSIEAGGKEAVEAVRALKGKNTTAEDVEAALNAGMNRINQVITDLEKGVGEIINEDTARILQAAGWGITSLGDGQYVIESVGNMVIAYQKIYEEMENTANHTTADLNKVYASLATALDQKNIDTRDTLTNAFDVSYDTLAELINKYRPDVLLKDVLNNPGAYGLELTGFGSVNIMDFGEFAETMGWQTGSPEFLEYYSQYVDQLIETSDAHSGKALQEHAMDNISAIADAKVGDKVNVTYLSALFDKIDSALLTTIMTQYGATLENGILTLNANADIPAIIAAVQRAATEAEALLPEQLAELSDTIAEFLAKIISLIKSGISGSLSHTDALDLQNWAKENGIDNLQLIETADGLQLTAESMALVYDKMQQIDSLQAKSLLPAIKDSNNNYKTLAGTLREVAEFEQRTASTNPQLAEARKTAQKLYSAGGGTVPLDFELRPHVDKDGFIETVRSTSAGIEGAEVLVTPILPDGSELSDATAQSYAEKFAKGEIKLTTKLVDDSGKALDYTFKDIYMGTFDSVEAADAAAEAYHNYHEEVLNANEALKELNGTEKAQQNLLRDLVREHLVTADSMNFMSSALPEGMQAVVNAWENTSTGMKALTEAEKNGYMGVQDFYNIITTASALMESAGRDFEVAGMNAAELMQSAGEHLKVVDGKLTVDLSSSGMNIVGSVGDLKNNLHDGIQELAKAEIEMLDAEIQVLEVLAAMEQLGDVDVNGNGIAFEIDDMFESQMVDGQNVRKFTKGMEDYLTNLEAYAAAHENVRTALEKIKLGNYSMWELVQSKDWAKWQAAGFTEQSLSQFLQTLTTMDWDVDNIQQQVADVLSGLQIGVSVELDNGLYVFTLTGEQFSFDWDNEEAMGNAKDAIEHWWGSDGKTTQAKVEELVQEYLTNQHADGTELSVDERWKVRMTLALASGEVTLKDDGKGTWSGRYHGKEFKGSKETVMDLIGQAMGYEEEGYTFEYNAEAGTVKGKLSVGRSEVTIDDSQATRQYIVDGHPFNSLEEAKGYLASKGEANASDAGRSFTFTNEKNQTEKWNIYTDAETGFTYTVKQGNNPEYVYDGQHFTSYDALTGYLQFRNKGASGTPVEGEPFKIQFESGLEMEYKLDDNGKDWAIIYTIGNHTFANEAEATKYIEATKKPGSVVSDDGGTVTYSFMGYECVATFNTEAGTVSYKLTLPDGGVIEAGDEYSLKAAIATHFQPEGGEVTGETSGGVNYTFTTPGSVSVQVETGANGKVNATIKGADTIGGQTNEQIEEKLTTYMTENPAKVQASVEAESVTLSIGDATVTLAEGETVEVTDPIPTVTGTIETLELTPQNVTIKEGSADGVKANESAETQSTNTITIKIDKTQAEESLGELKTSIDSVKKDATDMSGDLTITDNTSDVSQKIEALKKAIMMQGRLTISSNASSILSTINSIIARLNDLDGKKAHTTIYETTIKKTKQGTAEGTVATGTFGLAAGNAKAQGTLMGELGPELVVQNGRYFIAGQRGAEFVDLANDAIVFNHLQTESLLKNGMSTSRGRAVTNERVAASFAKGNLGGGDALASASAALAQLKALKAMWESLLNASVADMAGAGGGGGGGGGGGKDQAARASWIKEVERWYNLMQKIAQCEKDITHEETLRTKLNSDFRKNGKAYYDSQLQSLRLLQEQMVAQETLNISKREYFEQRREQLNTANGPFNQLYSFDENGQLKYNDTNTFQIGNGQTVTGGLAFLSEIMHRDEMNKPKYSAEEQYNMLVANGFEPFMHYDSSGGEILPPEEKEGEETDLTTWYTQSIQALFDHMDSQKEEMQNLHDSIEEGENKMLELQSDQNEILEEIRNNQMAVEQSILDAIIDQRQRAIDNLSNERDALEKSTQKYIEGLSDALNKERDMYQQNESSEELNRMRRQLAILQRSGGSGSEIRSLQDNIRTKEQDTYFEEQQRQIDAIQEASDLQLERLDAQIDLMTETLEYEKDYGLLWEAVYQKMAVTPEEITSFIMEENSKYWGLSPLKTDTEFQNALFQAEQWVAFRESQNEQLSNIYAKTADGMTIGEAVYGADGSWNIFTTAMTDLYGDQWTKLANDYKPIFQTQMAQTGDITKADVTTNATIKSELGSLGDKLVSALSKPDQVYTTTGNDNKVEGNSNNNQNQNNNSPSTGGKPQSTHTHNRNGGSRYVGSELHDFCTCGKDMGPRPGSTAASPAKNIGGVVNAIAGVVQGAITLFNGVTDTIKKTTTTKINSTSLTKNGSIPGTSKRTLSADAGGMIDETQMALVHAKEAVLTPEQTSILRNDILGSNKNSLMNLLLDFRSAYSGLDGSTYSSINDNNSLIIEHASVEMNVSKIANDYDAQRAGEQAMSKILEIARKTSAKNSIRR